MLNQRVCVPWVDDSMFLCGRGETGLTGNLYVGLAEYSDMGFLLHGLRESDTFVDIGANVGAYTILASKVIGCNSFAYEPLNSTVEKLKDQININRINSLVDVRPYGIGDKAEILYFTNDKNTVNKVSIKGDGKNTTQVEVRTLDLELSDNKKYILKIDVEGFEAHVIEGAKNILSSGCVIAVIVELNGSVDDFGSSNEDVHAKMIRFGFIPVSYDPRARALSRLESYNTKNGNTIYVNDIDFMLKRCLAAPPKKIHTAFDVSI